MISITELRYAIGPYFLSIAIWLIGLGIAAISRFDSTPDPYTFDVYEMPTPKWLSLCCGMPKRQRLPIGSTFVQLTGLVYALWIMCDLITMDIGIVDNWPGFRIVAAALISALVLVIIRLMISRQTH